MPTDWWYFLISSSTSALPLIAALLVWRRLDRPLKILAGMFLLACLTEVCAIYLAFHGISNLWAGHLWTAIEFSFLMLVFSYWQERPSLQQALRWSIPVFYAVLILNKILFESFSDLDSISRSIASVAIVGAAALTFHRIMVEPHGPLRRDSRLWVACAALIYHAGTLTLFTLGQEMMADNMAEFEKIYFIHSTINVFTNLLFAGGFLCRKRR